MKTTRLALLPLLLSPAFAGPALAGSDSGSLSVSVTVEQRCTLSAGSLDFGTYTSGQETDLLAKEAIAIESCPAGRFTFELNGGNAGSESARRLSSSSGESLAYQLYRDAQRTLVWGTGANGRVTVFDRPVSGTIPVYGVIPARQSVPAGVYTDTIQVTVVF